MTIDHGVLRRMAELIQSDSTDFSELVNISSLCPARSFRDTDLRNVDFGHADLSGYDFSGADLRGANLSNVRRFDLVIFNSNTIWPSNFVPPGFNLNSVHEMIFEEGDIPDFWFDFVYFLDLGPDSKFRPSEEPNRGLWSRWARSLANVPEGFIFRNLRRLDLSNTSMRDFVSVQRFSSLSTLSVANTSINDVYSIKNMQNLEELNLTNCRVVDISEVSELKNLKTLYLDKTDVVDLSPISNLCNLEELYLDRTQVQDVRPLRNMTNLKVLWLSRTKVTDASFLPPIKKLILPPGAK